MVLYLSFVSCFFFLSDSLSLLSWDLSVAFSPRVYLPGGAISPERRRLEAAPARCCTLAKAHVRHPSTSTKLHLLFLATGRKTALCQTLWEEMEAKGNIITSSSLLHSFWLLHILFVTYRLDAFGCL